MIPREDLSIPDGVKVVDLIIQTDETARQTFFLDTFLSHNIPLLLVGPTGNQSKENSLYIVHTFHINCLSVGTGKSAINNHFLVRLSKDKYVEFTFYRMSTTHVRSLPYFHLDM
jgi:dynein heavy chain, axonemal